MRSWRSPITVLWLNCPQKTREVRCQLDVNNRYFTLLLRCVFRSRSVQNEQSNAERHRYDGKDDQYQFLCFCHLIIPFCKLSGWASEADPFQGFRILSVQPSNLYAVIAAGAVDQILVVDVNGYMMDVHPSTALPITAAATVSAIVFSARGVETGKEDQVAGLKLGSIGEQAPHLHTLLRHTDGR